MIPLPHIAPKGMEPSPMNRDPIFQEWAVRLAGNLPCKGYVLEAIHEYRNPLWFVCRWKKPATGEKRPLPMRWNPDFKPKPNPWHPDPSFMETPAFLCKRPPKPSEGFPLYRGWNPFHDTAPAVMGWDTNNERPAIVWIVEGEWTADWLACMGFSVYTWPNGANNVEAADFRELAGLWVVLWPDNDAPGIDAMDKVRRILCNLGAHVATVDASALGLPAKADAVDWIKRFVADHEAEELADIPDGLALAVKEILALPLAEERRAAA